MTPLEAKALAEKIYQATYEQDGVYYDDRLCGVRREAFIAGLLYDDGGIEEELGNRCVVLELQLRDANLEIERLKGLLEGQVGAVVIACYSSVQMETSNEAIQQAWQNYKIENNL